MFLASSSIPDQLAKSKIIHDWVDNATQFDLVQGTDVERKPEDRGYQPSMVDIRPAPQLDPEQNRQWVLKLLA